MNTDDLKRAARDLIAGYKLSGMNNPEIGALLALCLAELLLDPDTSSELRQLIGSQLR